MNQATSKNKIFALALISLMLIQSVGCPVLAAKILGNPNLKAKGLISKTHIESYTVSRDNTLDFMYKYKDGSEKSFSDIPVFPNGTMIIPSIGERHVFGSSVSELQEFILEANEDLEEVEIFITRVPNNFSVLGEVENPGSFKLEDIRTIYDGLAKAEGFTDIAKKSKVKLIRQREDGSRYTYVINFPEEVFNAYSPGSGIGKEAYLLEEGDLIYVEASVPRKVWKIFKQAASAATLGIFAGLIGGAIN